jgi:plastocyanin
VKPSTRDRLVLPILLPIGLLVVIGLVLFGFSRILLSVSKTAATATALAVGLAIVVVAGIAAGRRAVSGSSLAGLIGAVAGVAMVVGGLAVATTGAAGEGEGEGGPVVEVTIVAVDIAFQQTDVTVPAGEPFRIRFQNQDAGVQHNVDIYDDPGFAGPPVFSGEIITGPAEVVYEVPALEAGDYPFNCVIHPNMQGVIHAVAEGGAGGPTLTVVAEDIAFDTDRIELPADTPATIVLENRDAGVLHNISIYADDTLAEVLFKGELITGPATIEYRIPPLPPGEYYFHCDVHPNMNGTVVVGGEAATGPTGAGA